MKVFGGRDVICDSNSPTSSEEIMASGTTGSDGFVVGMVELTGSGNCVCVTSQHKWHRLKDLVRRGFQAVSWG